MTPNLEVIHAYRHLYRGLLKAVQYSRPARYVVRSQMRQAFREPGATLDSEAVRRTVRFLGHAARERGLEHQIVKNLITVRGMNNSRRKRTWRKIFLEQGTKDPSKIPYLEHKRGAMNHYDMTVAMLNKTMGLCLR